MSRSIARKAGAILLLAALVAAMHLAPGLDTFVVQTGMRNSLHTIGFFAVAFVLFELLPGPLVVRGILTVLVAVGIGFLAETTQAYTGSSFDSEDAGQRAHQHPAPVGKPPEHGGDHCPHCRSCQRMRSDSPPSATTSRPMLWARSMVERTMVWSSSLRSSSSTKLLSILSSWTGSFLRCASDE